MTFEQSIESGAPADAGTCTKRPWTTREIERLRQSYGKTHPSIIARELGRTRSAVHQMAAKLRIVFDRRAELGPEFEQFLREKHAGGYSDADIAAEWGANRGTVGEHRRRLELPKNSFNRRHKKKLWMNYRKQLRECGAKSLGEVRSLVWRLRAFDRGWGVVSHTEADILDQLETGPKTRRMIADALGRPWRGCKTLVTHGGRSYMRILVKKGLVVRHGRKKFPLPGKAPTAMIYTLAPGVSRQKQRKGDAA